ncbi:MAG: nuclear transport factor 2 family protein [Gammaproteobacteria bacterium]|nr:nuclear transport factor 2 family protein [Gammaproteobacteria bacterium]
MAATLTPLERIEIRIALEDLNTAFTHYLDHNDVDSLVDLFTDDVLYTHGARRSEGRAEVERLFRNRAAAGPRTSRHMCSGLKLDIESRARASGNSVCMTFGQDGLPPLAPALPILVADFNDVYVRCGDGRWRIRERHIERIFVDPQSSGPVGYRPGTSNDAS